MLWQSVGRPFSAYPSSSSPSISDPFEVAAAARGRGGKRRRREDTIYNWHKKRRGGRRQGVKKRWHRVSERVSFFKKPVGEKNSSNSNLFYQKGLQQQQHTNNKSNATSANITFWNIYLSRPVSCDTFQRSAVWRCGRERGRDTINLESPPLHIFSLFTPLPPKRPQSGVEKKPHFLAIATPPLPPIQTKPNPPRFPTLKYK